MEKQFDEIIFKKKTFSDLLKDIYENSKNKEKQLKELIDKLSPLIQNIADANLLVPLIAEYVGMSIKNDEQLIKMAAIVQKALSSSSKEGSFDTGVLSKEEIEDLTNKAIELGKEQELLKD